MLQTAIPLLFVFYAAAAQGAQMTEASAVTFRLYKKPELFLPTLIRRNCTVETLDSKRVSTTLVVSGSVQTLEAKEWFKGYSYTFLSASNRTHLHTGAASITVYHKGFHYHNQYGKRVDSPAVMIKAGETNQAWYTVKFEGLDGFGNRIYEEQVHQNGRVISSARNMYDSAGTLLYSSGNLFSGVYEIDCASKAW